MSTISFRFATDTMGLRHHSSSMSEDNNHETSEENYEDFQSDDEEEAPPKWLIDAWNEAQSSRPEWYTNDMKRELTQAILRNKYVRLGNLLKNLYMFSRVNRQNTQDIVVESVLGSLISSDAMCREPNILGMMKKIIKVITSAKLQQWWNNSDIHDNLQRLEGVNMTTKQLYTFCDKCDYSVCVLANKDDGEQYVGVYDAQHKLIAVVLKQL